jgi:multiple sugar transport system permease protein
LKKGHGHFRAAMAFLAPNLIGFLLFTAGPVIFSLGASFTNWNLQQTVPLRFNGISNFSELLTDPSFWLYFVNTLYMMLGMPFAIFGALWLAVLLNRKIRGIGAFRTLLYLPSFASGVALMILWKALYNPDFGPINDSMRHVFAVLHIHADTPQWLQSTHNMAALDVEKVAIDKKQFGIGARDALILMGVWTAIGGNNMLLYLAALTNVPEELLEAAQLDGASPARCFRSVTWPQLAPTTFFILVMSIIGGLQGGFEQARIMTTGGPAGTTTTLAYYIYSLAFEQFRIGYASAVSWVLFAFVFTATLINWRFGNRAANDF